MASKHANIPKHSPRKIRSFLKSRKYEDLENLDFVENTLKKKRGYVFKLPKKNDPVIVLFSGGLDSSTTCALLMHEFKYRVYPVFFNTGFDRNKYEYEAAQEMARFFKDKYGGLFRPIKVINYAPLYPPTKQTTPIWNLSYDQLSNSIRCIYAMKYAYQLQEFNRTKIRTIFTAHVSSDGEIVSDQTLSSLRKTMLHICLGTNDFSWQVAALGLEKELGFFYGKEFQITWAKKHGIPLEITRTSCYRNGKLHCGQCAYCSARKEAFKNAGVTDKTIYADKLDLSENIIDITKRKIRTYLNI